MWEADHTRFAAGGEMVPNGEMGEMDDVERLAHVEVDRDVPSAVHKALVEDEHEVVQAVREHEHFQMTSDDWHLTAEAQRKHQTQYGSDLEFHIHYRTLGVGEPAPTQRKRLKHLKHSFPSRLSWTFASGVVLADDIVGHVEHELTRSSDTGQGWLLSLQLLTSRSRPCDPHCLCPACHSSFSS